MTGEEEKFIQVQQRDFSIHKKQPLPPPFLVLKAGNKVFLLFF